MRTYFTYPLQWPAGRGRQSDRRQGRFLVDRQSINLTQAQRRLRKELQRLGVEEQDVAITSWRPVRRDGEFHVKSAEPGDPAVAIYFSLNRKPMCMPCDTYWRMADNIAAIAAHIEATRAIERYGVATVEEMFAGFAALPSPDHERPWRVVLELRQVAIVTRTVAEAAYRRLARERHPDQGGSDAMMAELNRARDDARKELKA